MAADLATFRVAFPEFTTAAFPDATVNYWLEAAEGLTNRKLFGKLADQAVLNMAAHYLATQGQAANATAAGGAPGGVPAGAVTSKSVGGASISYDPSYGGVEGSGIYNSTIYGRRYATWARLFGAGGVQL